MSGIDCSTQTLNQQYTEPFVAIVIDPVSTCIAGKVEIGAFRTYPHGYMPPYDKRSRYQTVPLHKVEDFGAHANRYYSLHVSLFRSGLDCAIFDLLWSEYWINLLSYSPLQMNRPYLMGQVSDLAKKLKIKASDTEVTEGWRTSSASSSHSEILPGVETCMHLKSCAMPQKLLWKIAKGWHHICSSYRCSASNTTWVVEMVLITLDEEYLPLSWAVFHDWWISRYVSMSRS